MARSTAAVPSRSRPTPRGRCFPPRSCVSSWSSPNERPSAGRAGRRRSHGDAQPAGEEECDRHSHDRRPAHPAGPGRSRRRRARRRGAWRRERFLRRHGLERAARIRRQERRGKPPGGAALRRDLRTYATHPQADRGGRARPGARGGCGLATACDLVLATQSATFGYPEVQRGFVPAIVTTLLKRTAGEKVAFDLAATGRILGASEAAVLGLVSRVYEDSDFEDQAGEVVRALAAASPSALAFTKQQFYQLDGVRFEEGIRLGADVNAVSRTTPDFRAALQAFLKK